MRAITLVRNDGSWLTVAVPAGMCGPFLLRQLHRAKRGDPIVGCTDREMAWLADLAARLIVEPVESAA